MGIGQQGHVGVGKETAWGTAVAATDYVEALSESIVTTVERFEIKNIVAGLYEPDDMAGVHRHEGQVTFAAHPAVLGRVLDGVFGANAVTSIGGGLFSNVFTPATSNTGSLHPLPSYTLEVYRPGASDVGSSFRYAGAQFGSVALSVAPNQDVRAVATLVAKTRAWLTKSTPSYSTTPVNPFAFDTTSVQIGGAAVARAEALSITFDNQIAGVPALNNSTEIARIRREGSQLVRVSGTLEFEDHTDFETFVDQTEQAFLVSFFRADSHSLVVDVPRLALTSYPVQLGGRERTTVDFDAIGRYHTGSSSALKVTLTTTNTF